MLDDPEAKPLTDAIRKRVTHSFSNIVTDLEIQNICDSVGISTRGYQAIHQALKDALRSRGITENLFPLPHKVAIAKKASNEDVMRQLGDYLHIEDTMFLQAQGNGAKARGKGRSVVANNAVQGEGYVYTKLNNIFVDLIKLQQSMVAFYNFSDEGEFHSSVK